MEIGRCQMTQSKAAKKADTGKYHVPLLAVIKAWLPVLTVVIGALWGLYEFIDTQKKLKPPALFRQRRMARRAALKHRSRF